jgi:hypothetical protein
MTIADQPPTHDMREADTILREAVYEAIDSAEKALRSGELCGWELELIRRRVAAWADAQKAPQPRTAPEQPVVACVIDLDGHDYLCWKGVAVETYSDKPQRDLIYAAPQPRAAERWPREAEDRVNTLLGELAAKELECQRLREASRAAPAEPAPAPADEPPHNDCGKSNAPPPDLVIAEKPFTEAQRDERIAALTAKLQAERGKP